MGDLSKRPRSDRGVPMSATPQKLRLLIVEDNDDHAELVRLMLMRADPGGCAFTRVTRLDQAIAQLAQSPCDVTLLDLTLPDSRGVETVTRLRQAAPETPIVVLTAHEDRQHGLQTVRAGAQDYLVKDKINGEALHRILRYAIERKRAENAERERQTLQGTVTAMEQLLGVVAHELRSPLAGLRAMAEIMQDLAGDADQQWRNHAKYIQDTTARMTETIDDLLEAARGNSGRIQWRWTELALDDVVREAVEIARPLIPEPRVLLRVAGNLPSVRIHGDPGAIRRLIFNLLHNAAKNTEQGGIEVRLTQDQLYGHPAARITVTDTGRGMPPDHLDQVGERFSINDAAHGADHTGMGLGLWFCRSIVAAHAGTLAIASQPGIGTRVEFTLRADLPSPEAADAPLQPITKSTSLDPEQAKQRTDI